MRVKNRMKRKAKSIYKLLVFVIHGYLMLIKQTSHPLITFVSISKKIYNSALPKAEVI